MKTANQLTFTTYEASLKLKAPSNGTFTNFRDRLGEDIFYEILHQLITQAIVLKVITGGDTAIDSTYLWAYSSKFGKKTGSGKGKCHPRDYSDPDAQWGAKSKDYIFLPVSLWEDLLPSPCPGLSPDRPYPQRD